MGERLSKVAREGDVIARLGGDEFAVIQVGSEQPQASEAFAARLVDLISRTYVVDRHMLNIARALAWRWPPATGRPPTCC